MKSLLVFIVICLIGVGILYVYDKSLPQQIHEAIYYSRCDNTIQYAVGRVDPQFNISKDEFASDIQQAASIWSNAEGKTLFAYNQNAILQINFVYDQRQFLNSKINQLKNQVDSQDSTLQSQIAAYKTQVADYKNKLNQLNSKIDEWNSKGGAPPDVFNQLIQQENQLKQEGEQLNAKAQSLNLSTEDYNSQVSNLNNTVDKFNQTLAQKPEEGLYDPQHNSISIYFNNSHDELVHTLAHELGHSLGMGHDYDQNGIMFPYTTSSITLTQQDLNELTQACKIHPIWERFMTNLSYLINQFKKSS